MAATSSPNDESERSTLSSGSPAAHHENAPRDPRDEALPPIFHQPPLVTRYDSQERPSARKTWVILVVLIALFVLFAFAWRLAAPQEPVDDSLGPAGESPVAPGTQDRDATPQ